MKIVLIHGLGLGKTFLAKAMMKVYESMPEPVFARLKVLEYETAKEAAAVIKKAEAAAVDVLVMVAKSSAEHLEIEPWQAILVSGGRPLFKAGRPAVDANENVG